MTTSAVDTRACDSMLACKDILAREVTEAQYAADPELLERFGEAGRTKCLQDAHHCIEHLAAAVAFGDPLLFARYAIWLESLLAARGIGSHHIRQSFEITQRAIEVHLHPDDTERVSRCIEAGLTSLSHVRDA